MPYSGYRMSDDSVFDPHYEYPTIRVPDDILDDAARKLAAKLWDDTEPARRWLEERRRGEGDPDAASELSWEIGSRIVDCARTIEEMEKDEYDHLESYTLLQETLTRLRKLDDEVRDQHVQDLRSGEATSVEG